MNRLLNGVAIAGALTLAAPALAQNMASPMSSPPPPAAAAPAPAPAAPMPASSMPAPPKPKKVVHHRRRAPAKPPMTEANQLTQQLNQEELQRVQSNGGPSAPMPPGPPPAPMPSYEPMPSGPRPSPTH